MYLKIFIKIYDNILLGKLSKYFKYNYLSIYRSIIISYIYGVGVLLFRKVF